MQPAHLQRLVRISRVSMMHVYISFFVKSYNKCVGQTARICTPLRAYVRPSVTILVIIIVSPPKPLAVTTLNFAGVYGTWCRGY